MDGNKLDNGKKKKNKRVEDFIDGANSKKLLAIPDPETPHGVLVSFLLYV